MFCPNPDLVSAWARVCRSRPLASVGHDAAPREAELLKPFFTAFTDPVVGPALARALLHLAEGSVALDAIDRLDDLVSRGELVVVGTPAGLFGPDAALAEVVPGRNSLNLLVPLEAKARRTKGQASRYTTVQDMTACFPEVVAHMAAAKEYILDGRLDPDPHTDDGCHCHWPPEMGWKYRRDARDGRVKGHLCVPQLVQAAFVEAFCNTAPIAVVGRPGIPAPLSEDRIGYIDPATRGLWICPQPRTFAQLKQCYGWDPEGAWMLNRERFQPVTFAQVLTAVIAILETTNGFRPQQLPWGTLVYLQQMGGVVWRAATPSERRLFLPLLPVLAQASAADGATSTTT
jgi:hypothetical protein